MDSPTQPIRSPALAELPDDALGEALELGLRELRAGAYALRRQRVRVAVVRTDAPILAFMEEAARRLRR